jgi:putative transposase
LLHHQGDCWDNSVAESFLSRLKDERVFWRNYQSRDEAKNDIFELHPDVL